MTDIRELVVANRSYRSFDPMCKVSMEELTDMIDCARMSPSAMNRQPLRYRIVLDDDERKQLVSIVKLAALIKDRKFPPEGHEPPAYIVICRDSALAPSDASCAVDMGIAAEVITLSAVELGLGGCMAGNFSREEVKKALSLPEGIEPMLIILIGKPDETSIICRAADESKTAYFRDSHNVHYVPKLDMEKVII